MNSTKSFSLEEIASLTNCKVVGDPCYRISNATDLESAGPNDISFFAKPTYTNSRYEGAMRNSSAGAIFIKPEIKQEEGRNYLVTADPSRSFQKLVEAFWEANQDQTERFQGIHPTAIIHDTVQIGEGVTISPYVTVEAGTTIGTHTSIGPGCAIGVNVSIGNNCTFYANAVIREECVIGNNVIIQPGAVIGSCGFGYTTDKKGQHTHLKQLGNVIIEDNVEIGANTTIDRARFKSTRIARGTKIDNLVMIGHGVNVGEDNFIVAQTGIAGSASTGKHVVLAGQSAVNGHIHIGDHVIIAAKSGATKTIDEPGKYGGVPVQPLEQYNRNTVHARKMAEYAKTIRTLEKKVEELSQSS